MIKKILLTLLATSIYAGPVHSNDTAGTLLPTGEIRFEKQDGIVLKHEALLLSDTITVDYLFENTTDKPITTTIFFPIPTLGPIVSYMDTPHDFKFRVWSDEQEITPSLNHKITLHDTDVTKYFNLMGIDSYFKAIEVDFEGNGPVFEKVAAPLRKLPLAEQKKLEKLGMLAKGCMEEEINDPCRQAFEEYEMMESFEYLWKSNREEFSKEWTGRFGESVDFDNLQVSPQKQVLAYYLQCKERILAGDKLKTRCAHNPDIYHLKMGQAKGPDSYHREAIYSWTQTFPPHQTVHIRHEYKPSFHSNSLGGPNILGSSAFVNTKGEYNKSYGFWHEAAYIITTANNWKTPIGKFDLLIWGGVGAAVSAPQKGELYTEDSAFSRLAPRNYLLETRQDFIPSKEILFDLSSKFEEDGIKGIDTYPQLYRVDGPANVRAKPNGKEIATLENGHYVWAYPADKKDWFVVLLDEKTDGYTHKTNLVPFGK